MYQHPNILSTPEHFINTRTFHRYPNIASTPEHCINTQTFHWYPNIASTHEHFIDIRTLHQHLNIASTFNIQRMNRQSELLYALTEFQCINIQTLHQQQNNSSPPEYCISTRTLHCRRLAECLNSLEDIPHPLQLWSTLYETRQELLDFTRKHAFNLLQPVSELILKLVNLINSSFCQVLLVCSVVPEVFSVVRYMAILTVHIEFSEVTRTWVFKLHSERLNRLHLWNVG